VEVRTHFNKFLWSTITWCCRQCVICHECS